MPEPDYAYRTFYTWDHSTNWDLSQPGTRVDGCSDPYEKPPEAFLADYRGLIDYMHQLGLNHLIIWGALRDSHGGVGSLRKLIEHGRSRGVRVAPGVGVNSYGGVYYDSDHEFSLVALLRKHPELAALDKNGKPILGGNNPRSCVSCPRNEKMRDWTLRSVRWLMEEIGPDAIHFESGDYGVCNCKLCRSAGPRDWGVSDLDIAEILPIIAEVRQFSKDCLLSYNHYTGYTKAMMTDIPAFAKSIPSDVICKWGVSWMLAPEFIPPEWRGKASVEPVTPEVKPPTSTSMAHFHFGTGWWNCSPRGTLEITRIMKAMPLLKAVGFQGICTHGEESYLNPPCEMNYQVYAALAERANASTADIAKRQLGELYGSAGLMTEVLTAYKDQRVPPKLPPAVARAAAKANDQVKVRLNWLAFEIQRLAERTRPKNP